MVLSDNVKESISKDVFTIDNFITTKHWQTIFSQRYISRAVLINWKQKCFIANLTSVVLLLKCKWTVRHGLAMYPWPIRAIWPVSRKVHVLNAYLRVSTTEFGMWYWSKRSDTKRTTIRKHWEADKSPLNYRNSFVWPPAAKKPPRFQLSRL